MATRPFRFTLARDLATLDLLSDGRVEVGIGAGHSEPEYERAGIPFDPAATRVARLEGQPDRRADGDRPEHDGYLPACHGPTMARRRGPRRGSPGPKVPPRCDHLLGSSVRTKGRVEP